MQAIQNNSCQLSSCLDSSGELLFHESLRTKNLDNENDVKVFYFIICLEI